MVCCERLHDVVDERVKGFGIDWASWNRSRVATKHEITVIESARESDVTGEIECGATLGSRQVSVPTPRRERRMQRGMQWLSVVSVGAA